MTDAGRDLYQVLGIDLHATPADVRRAYRRRAQAVHPDTAEAGTDEAMALVNQAWFVLRDPQRRAAYDRARRSGEEPAPVGQRDQPDPGWHEDHDLGFESGDLMSRRMQRTLQRMVVATVILLSALFIAIFLIGFGRVGTG